MTRLRSFQLALSVSIVAILVSPIAVGWHDAPEPLVDAVAFEGVHWVAWRFTTATDGPVVIELLADATDVELAAFGVSIMDGDGSNPDTGWVVSQVATTHVFVQTSGDAPSVDSRTGLGSGVFGGWFKWFNVPAGDHIALAIATASGTVGAGEFELHASGGATLLGKTEGTTSFAAVARDFAGEANVRVGTPSAMVTAIADVAHERAFTDQLFAFYWRHPSTSVNPLHPLLCDIRYEGPDGGGAEQQYYFIDAAPPGTYTFRVPHCADVGAGPFRTQLFVIGADVHLPT